MRYNKQSLEKLRERRSGKWRQNLAKSPFYKGMRQLALREFPLMDKSAFMGHFDDINTKGITKSEAFESGIRGEKSRNFTSALGNVTVGLSSGTSGNRGIFLASPEERAIWVASILDRVIGFSLKKRKVAFFLRANSNLYESVKSSLLQFHFFDTRGDMQQHIETVIELRPQILVGQPSVLLFVARHFEKNNINAGFTKIISVAEVLEEDQKQYFEKVFRQRVEQVYQCTEGFLAHTCSEGFLHFNEDWLIIEKKYIDVEKKRFHPVITDYLRTTQPIIRYELNDIIHEGVECKCGLKTTQIAKIEGRSDDVFFFERNGIEITIYPDFVRQAVAFSSDLIDNYVVVQESNAKIGLFIEVVEGDFFNEYRKAENALLSLFEIFKVSPVIIVREQQLPPAKGGKFKRIRNESNKAI